MKNRYLIAMAIAAVMVLSVAFIPAATAGNGITENGKHYSLNILGKEKTKGWAEPESGSYHDNGHRIFVQLTKNDHVSTRINLVMGDDFQVIDPDGTDGKATLQLPDPYDTADYPGDYAYYIYVRALGKPNDNRYANITLNAANWTSGIWYEGAVVHVIRTNGPPKFAVKTIDLTTVYDEFGTAYHLFDEGFEEFWWDYDNYGLRHLQIRFYPAPLPS